MISLFHEQHNQRRGVSPYAVSSVLHAMGLLGLSWGLLHAPRIEEPITERYSVRRLELHTPEPQAESAAAKAVASAAAGARAGVPNHDSSRPDPAALDVAALHTADGAPNKQTLVQPEFHAHQAMSEEAPVPTVVIWTPELASMKQIVAPLPSPPTASTAQPALDPPNEELNLADMAIASTNAPSTLPAPAAATTSPIAMNSKSLVNMAPATVSNSADQPTPTAVMSLSDVRMVDGSIVLPPVNETRSNSRGKDAAVARPQSSGAAGVAVLSSSASGTASGAGESLDQQPGETAEHIVMPKDGKFGVVVVGSSLADAYPETLQIWNDRVAYTAYLHVGLSKSWILQYAQTRSAETASGGTVTRLEAPWPYDILRPNLISRDLNADALMIHGVVNENGRFESLAIAFPTEFSHARFVLHALQQWQFRPARQNGKPTAVEVLLIIPDELD